MWQSFKEYVLATGRWGWVILVDILLGGAGAYLDISGTWELPRWVWVTMVGVAVLIGPFIAFHKIRQERDEATNEVRSALSELESEVIRLGGQSITMAKFFSKIGDCFLGEGMKAGSTPGSIYKVVEGADEEECNKAWGNLNKKLRLLQLISDVQRPHPYKSTGYMVIVLTSLGTSVLNELDRRWRSS